VLRLTLRTLLAYLDDTLDPSEIKQIGQKVADSETAQELIERIKKVTRRRRLTTPPLTGPGVKFDPNTVSEYLDNELSAEQVAELEKTCLESDVHLAEIATCHQILTLVLGEPALVPPTAKERMYGLVQGREAIPFRKAPQTARAGATTGADGDADEPFLFSSPFSGKKGWLRWALPAAAVLLIAALGVAWWQAQPSRQKEVASVEKEKDKDKPNGPKDGGKPGETPVDDSHKKLPDDSNRTDDSNKKPPEDGNKTTVEDANKKPEQPSTERREAGKYVGAANANPSILVRRKKDKDREVWRRVPKVPTPDDSPLVYTSETLVSLPGYASEVLFNNRVRLQLWGSLPEFTRIPFLLESAVTPHYNPNFDLDLTLERGRIFLSNQKEKGPARVRLRFQREIWDLTLEEPDSEVAIDLNRNYNRDIDFHEGEEPKVELYLYVARGKVGLRVDSYHEFPNLTEPPGPAWFQWDNKGAGTHGPIRLADKHAVFSKDPPMTPEAKAAREALEDLSRQLVATKAVEVALLEEMKKGQTPSIRNLSIVSFGAVDAVPQLFGILADEDVTYTPDRITAIFTLRRWISRGVEQGKLIYDGTKKGPLLDKRYRDPEARIIFDLLHDFDDVHRNQPETYRLLINYLQDDRMVIRELAYWHLQNLLLGEKGPPYSAAWPSDQREASVNEWKKMLEAGKLPPTPKEPPMGPPGGPPPPPRP
jgi:hypothetical protein